MGKGALFQFCRTLRKTAERRFDVQETHFLDDKSTPNCQLWFVHVTRDIFYDQSNTVFVVPFWDNIFRRLHQLHLVILAKHVSYPAIHQLINEFATAWHAGINWSIFSRIVVVLTSNSWDKKL